MYRIRTNWLGLDCLQEYRDGKWRTPAERNYPLCEVVILAAGEFEEMQARIAQAEKRAEAQRKGRAQRSKACPPSGIFNPLETA